MLVKEVVAVSFNGRAELLALVVCETKDRTKQILGPPEMLTYSQGVSA